MSAVSKSTMAQEEGPKSIKDIMVPLIAIIIGLFMVILDNTAVNVALPKLVDEFNSSLTVLQWTVTGYMLAQAAVIPLAGWLSDRFGAKRIFLISVGMFTIGSLLCAIASDPAQLIIFRILQGFGGGMVMPIAMAFTYRLAPPSMVGAVMGVMGIPILLAPALGPVLSGWLVDFASWNWIFIINLPIGIVGLFIGIRYLPKIDRQSVASLDVWGMILGPLAFASLIYGVNEGSQKSWTSIEAVLGLSIGFVALLVFIFVELRQKQPMLELRVFRSFDFTRAIIIQWITTIGLFGTMFLIPLFLQQAKGYSAFDTGLIMLPQALAAAIFMPVSGKLFDRIGARPLVMIGMGIIAVAAFLFSQINATDGISMLMLPLAMLGAGMGLCMMPLNTHIIQASPQNLVGRVTSLTNATQLVVSSFAIAALASYLMNHMTDYMKTDGKTNVEAFALAFGDTFLIIVGISIFGTILGLMLTKPKTVKGAEKSTEPSMMIG